MTHAPIDLPPLYARWMADALGGSIPNETEATCSDCAMCTPASIDARAADGAFDPTTKCCTYLPALANYLVGAILADPSTDPAGRASVLARIDAGIGVSPLGLERTPLYETLYRHGAGRAFGRSRALRCPHYLEHGACGIWQHRESTCATWFCKHVRGAVGHAFWRASLQPLLCAVERGLARFCVLELELEPDVLKRLLSPTPLVPRAIHQTLGAEDLDSVADPKVQRARWGRWAGREIELYEACARLVAPLSWGDVTSVCGPEVRMFERAARYAYDEMCASEIPTALAVGAFAIVESSAAHLRISTYSEYDPLDLPRDAFDALRCFDGRPTDDAVAAIASEHGLEFDATLLRQLVDFGVLVKAARDE